MGSSFFSLSHFFYIYLFISIFMPIFLLYCYCFFICTIFYHLLLFLPFSTFCHFSFAQFIYPHSTITIFIHSHFYALNNFTKHLSHLYFYPLIVLLPFFHHLYFILVFYHQFFLFSSFYLSIFNLPSSVKRSCLPLWLLDLFWSITNLVCITIKLERLSLLTIATTWILTTIGWLLTIYLDWLLFMLILFIL